MSVNGRLKFLIFLACSVFAVNVDLGDSCSGPDLEEWQAYKIRYNKIYSTQEEEERRMEIFIENKEKIEEHNARYQKGEETFKMGVNQFTDLLISEFEEMFTSFVGDEMDTGYEFIPPANVVLPDEVNWIKKGAVTPVKNELQCSASWAFSATGALEGQHFRKTNKLVPLSEQNLIDCSTPQGNRGCKGGSKEKAFTYIKKNKGIDTEASYPFEGKDLKCRFNPNTVGAKTTGYKRIKSGDVNALKAAVATVGPIAASIHAGFSVMAYQGGYFADTLCRNRTKDLNHGVLIVGYGKDVIYSVDYWIVKNSWGDYWGEGGYMRMLMGLNLCGIEVAASYPLV